MKPILPILIIFCFTVNLFAQQPGDIIITEIMQNPDSVADGSGEWFEIYNTTDFSIDINGWLIKDGGTDDHIIDNGGPLLVDPKNYFVIGRDINPLTNGGVQVHYELSGIFLANGDDEIILEFNGVQIDSVGYDGGSQFPDPTGASMNLSSQRFDYLENDTGVSWCVSTMPYGDGDLGTPGQPNSDCGLPPLPISLISFTAEEEAGKVKLDWLVGFESNFDYYSLEHSIEGRDFKEVDYRPGQGTLEGEISYAYEHESPATMRRNYYRLKMVDLDGRYRYSQIVEVLLENKTTLVLGPNPAHNYLDFWYAEKNYNETAQYAVYNAMGQRLIQGQFERDDATRVDLGGLTPGIYFLSILNEEKSETVPFVKQ